jgi:hypothetical protein
VTGIGHEHNLDLSHAVVKRIGFAQIPLVCVMFRLVREAYKYALRNNVWEELADRTTSWMWVLLCSTGWVCLLAIKIALGRLLQRLSLAKLRAAPQVIDLKKLPKDKKKK